MSRAELEAKIQAGTQTGQQLALEARELLEEASNHFAHALDENTPRALRVASWKTYRSAFLGHKAKVSSWEAVTNAVREWKAELLAMEGSEVA